MIRTLLALALLATAAHATTLTASPSYQVIYAGETAIVTVAVEDLPPDRLGGYDFTVSWDSAIVDLIDAVFLSPTGIGDGLVQVDPIGTGIWEFAAVYFADPADIQNQPASFPILELTFKGLQRGISPVVIGPIELTDAFGEPFDAAGETAAIEVITPEPGTASALTLAALAGFAALRIRARRRS